MILLKNIVYYFIYALNIIAVIGLLCSYLASYVSPNTTVIFAYFGLAYPLFLIINICFAIYWGIKKNKKAILSVIVLLLGWSQFFQFFQFPFNSSEVTDSNSIKVMSYNVRLFDLYDWTKQENVKGKILDLINEKGPDVVCFQEYYLKGRPTQLKKTLNLPFVHQYFTESTFKKGKKAGIGTAIYSKYKIINKGEILFEEEQSNHCTYVDILKDKDTIRVYNAHLGSIRFDYDDYTFIEGVKKDGLENDIGPLKRVAKRLKSGFEKRVGQVEVLLAHIDKSPYPTIIATDMNDTPVSYSYKQFSTNLSDSFNEKGNWVGSTYIGAIPMLRIDYLWHNDKFENTSFQTINREYSDHKPIEGIFTLKK